MMETFEKLGYPGLPPVEGIIRPFWSVVIPVNKRREFLSRCLNSVMSQWLGKDRMEVIVWDTGNEPFGQLPLDVQWHWAKDKGTIRNWNDAIRCARGHWIHLLHDDDWVEPGFYAALEDGLQGSNYGAAMAGCEPFGDGANAKLENRTASGELGGMPESLDRGNWLWPASVVLKRETYEEVGLFHPDLTWCPDWDMWRRAAEFSKWHFCMRAVARYRVHGEEQDAVSIEDKYRSIRQAIRLANAWVAEPRRDSALKASKANWWGLALQDAMRALNQGREEDVVRITQEAQRFFMLCGRPEREGHVPCPTPRSPGWGVGIESMGGAESLPHT